MVNTSGHVAAIFRAPRNPHATLSGLPAELRLQIYSHLCDSTIIHVHHHRGHNAYTSRFTWTPCRSSSSASPLLCANPKWSGMCDEDDRCTHKIDAPPEPVGFWALAACNKFIRNETQEFFLGKTIVSIHPHDLRPWLNHLAVTNARRLDSLRRVTLAGAYSYKYFGNAELQLIRDLLPNLEGLGFQFQDYVWRWTSTYLVDGEFDVYPTGWKRWPLVAWLKDFDPSITIALEAMVWVKPNRYHHVHNFPEQQVTISVIRKGKMAENNSSPGSGWTDEDVDIEVVRPGRLGSPKRTAQWRQWWRGKETKGFT